ncbi:type II toxin-antitoxin system HicA family toxin [Candidatus Venteria ishoeyi]|uniref:type II toxin-antitoxin system HicA family toxin n=1 Tax=Candidatus Venteria ishoeyi TaxID=1899563 RepID=UPI000CDEF151|nr:type II toxin-antitoxin system HicA family toxin [Candidatus Venteria ishoeyi]MDM8547182.1 type II toxin-antitoxin system HicA family toxin [Candidatus Venteria ishoeyi]
MFFRKIPSLTYRDVIKGLKKLGFEKRKNKSTAHEQWVANDPFRKVTVDKHIAPFSEFLIKSMAKQAGVSTNEFCSLCKNKKYKPSTTPSPESE